MIPIKIGMENFAKCKSEGFKNMILVSVVNIWALKTHTGFQKWSL